MDLLGEKPQKQRPELLPCENIFPEDILGEIFCHVGYKTLVQFASVCKTWRKIALSDKVWKSLTNRYSIYFPTGLKFPSRTISALKIVQDYYRKSKLKSITAGWMMLETFSDQEIEPLLADSVFIAEVVKKQTGNHSLLDKIISIVFNNKDHHAENFDAVAAVMGEANLLQILSRICE
jgi:hypothetical protein